MSQNSKEKKWKASVSFIQKSLFAISQYYMFLSLQKYAIQNKAKSQQLLNSLRVKVRVITVQGPTKINLISLPHPPQPQWLAFLSIFSDKSISTSEPLHFYSRPTAFEAFSFLIEIPMMLPLWCSSLQWVNKPSFVHLELCSWWSLTASWPSVLAPQLHMCIEYTVVLPYL